MSTQTSTDTGIPTPVPGNGYPMRFEATVIPVADVDRAKAFYERLGWRMDIDFHPTATTRGVQFTPPGSQASVQFGSGTPATAPPGSLRGLILVVDDILAAREDLISRGVEVSDLWHVDPEKGPTPGPDPGGRSYFTRASFSDPDGNSWDLQEITERLPGRD
jgi:catechol 2,3-dioxygenase-like lactoylglutathione lyase family enzyme